MRTNKLSNDVLEDLNLYRLYIDAKINQFNSYEEDLFKAFGDLYERKKWYEKNHSKLNANETFLSEVYKYKDEIKSLLGITLDKYRVTASDQVYYEDIAIRFRKSIKIVLANYEKTVKRVDKLLTDIYRYEQLLHKIDTKADPFLIKELQSLEEIIPINYINYVKNNKESRSKYYNKGELK